MHSRHIAVGKPIKHPVIQSERALANKTRDLMSETCVTLEIQYIFFQAGAVECACNPLVPSFPQQITKKTITEHASPQFFIADSLEHSSQSQPHMDG